MSVVFDEALPYYKGPFYSIPEYVEDPPTIAASQSMYTQRFYMSLAQTPAVCRSMQYRVDLPAENAQNEILTVTLFGALLIES